MECEQMTKSYSKFDFWENIFEGIDCIYSAALFDRWLMVTNKVAAITNSDKVSLSLVNQNNAEPLLYLSNTDYSSAENVNKKAYNDSETTALSQGVRLFPKTSTPDNVLLRHCYYCQHIINAGGVAYQMLFTVSKYGQKQIYSEEDLATLLYLLPSLITSLTAFTSQKNGLNRLAILEQTIVQGSKGIILLDRQDKITFVNQFMQSHLIKNDFMKIINNELVLNKHYENIKFYQLLNKSSQQSYDEINSMTLDNSEGSHALIFITPLSKPLHCHSGVATKMVTVNFEQLMNWSLFANEYQLTNKELNLLKALYKNKKLTELPLQIGVTINTLRTHLQSIFRKSQTNSQVELMIRLSMYKI
jgi:DNA-binding CsgD family transcriptional regulator